MIGTTIDGTAWINGVEARGILSIEQEVRTERFSQVDDPALSWEHVDSAGHFHAWAKDATLPTLVKSRRDVPCDGSCNLRDCDGYAVPEWHCRICGEKVEPGHQRKYNVTRTFPGLTSWSLAVTGRPDLPFGSQDVGVRIRQKDREWFGIGYVTSTSFTMDEVALVVVGNGALGERHVYKAVAA